MRRYILKVQNDKRTTSPPSASVREPIAAGSSVSPRQSHDLREKIRSSVPSGAVDNSLLLPNKEGCINGSNILRPTILPAASGNLALPKDTKAALPVDHPTPMKAPQRPIRSSQPPSTSVMSSFSAVPRPVNGTTRNSNVVGMSSNLATGTALLASSSNVALSSSQSSAGMWEASLPRRIEKAKSHMQLYLLNKAGPNSFTLISGSMNNVNSSTNSDDTSFAQNSMADKEPPAIQCKYKVTIGPQTCSCGRGPLCVHLLFVMIRVLHVHEDDPQLRAKNLCNYQVETLMREYDKRNSKLMRHARRFRSRSTSRTSNALGGSTNDQSDQNLDGSSTEKNSLSSGTEKEDSEENNCTICLLPMRDGEILSLCNSSCHNKFHRNCITVWFDECRRQQEALKCPLCRSVWGSSNPAPSNQGSTIVTVINSIDHNEPSDHVLNEVTEEVSPQQFAANGLAGGNDFHTIASPMTSSIMSNLSAQSPSISGSNSQSNSFRAKQRRRRLQELEALISRLLTSSPSVNLSDKTEESHLIVSSVITTSSLLNQLNSSIWDERENGLKQLTNYVVQRIMGSQQYPTSSEANTSSGSVIALATFRLSGSLTMLECAFGVVAILLTDSNYKVFVASMRAFREILSYVACESTSVRSRVQNCMHCVLHRLLQQCGHEMKRRSDLAVSMLQELARGQQGALAAGKEISSNSPGVSHVKFVFGFVVREVIYYESQSMQNSSMTTRTDNQLASRTVAGISPGLSDLLGARHINGNLCSTSSPQQQTQIHVSSNIGVSILGALRVFDKFLALPELDSDDIKSCLECTARLLPLLSTWRVMNAHVATSTGGVISPTGMGSGPGSVSNSDLVHKAHRVLVTAMQVLCERNLLSSQALTDFVESHMKPYLSGEQRLWRKISRIISAWEEQTRRRLLTSTTNNSGQNSRRGSSPRILPPGSFTHMSTLIRITPEPAYDQAHISAEEIAISTAIAVERSTEIEEGISENQEASLIEASDQVELRVKSKSGLGGRSPRSSAVNAVEDPYDRAFCTTQQGPRPASSAVVCGTTRSSLRTSLRNSHASVEELKKGEEQLSQKEQACIREALLKALENSRLQTALPVLPAFDNKSMSEQVWWHNVQLDTFPPIESATHCYEENQQWTRGPLLGTGAWCHCFQVRDVHTGSLMAMKEISLARTSTKESQEVLYTILSEIRIMSRLDHANVTRLLGVVHSAEEQVIRLFVEWMPGGSVAGLLSRYGAFTEPVTIQYTLQLLNGLSYLHNMHILHRDLKGANLLVNASGNQLRISDFGASTVFQDSENSGHQSYQGHLLGTVAFMAPELLRGESDYSRASDIWSVGCVTIEMITSKPPWSENQCSNHLALIYTIASSQDPPLIPECTSQPLKQFLHICFNIKPSDRLSAEKLLALQVFDIFQKS